MTFDVLSQRPGEAEKRDPGNEVELFSQLARQCYMGNSCNHDLLHARGGEDLAKIYFSASICHHSDFFIS